MIDISSLAGSVAAEKTDGRFASRINIMDVSNLILLTYDQAAFRCGRFPYPMNIDRLCMHLFLCQGMSFVQRGFRLFPETFTATKNSVVSTRILEHYGGKASTVLTGNDVDLSRKMDVRFDLLQQKVVFDVSISCSDKSDRQLHKEITSLDCWKAAKESVNQEVNRGNIKKDFMRMYHIDLPSHELDYSFLFES
jgi:hypothetical protein